MYTNKIIDSSYWNGMNCKVYANNIQIEDAIQINYMVQEQVRAFYDYSKYVCSRICHGARSVNGELTVNFKQDGYLFALLDLLSSQSPGNLAVQNPSKPLNTILPISPDIFSGNQSISVNKLSNPDIARQFVSARKIDQASISSPVNNYETNTSQGLFQTKDQGFNLDILFGAEMSSAQILRLNSIGYTTITAPSYSNLDMPGMGTGIRLVGVEIQGSGRSIGDDGRSINETYSFMARDIRILKNVGGSASRAVKTALNQNNANRNPNTPLNTSQGPGDV